MIVRVGQNQVRLVAEFVRANENEILGLSVKSLEEALTVTNPIKTYKRNEKDPYCAAHTQSTLHTCSASADDHHHNTKTPQMGKRLNPFNEFSPQPDLFIL